MLTENLQEIIKADAKEDTFKELTPTSLAWDAEKEDDFLTVLPDSHSPIERNGHHQTSSIILATAETELIPQESATEDDLVAYTKFLHARMAISTVQCYWLIGKSILSFYQGKYGTGELQRISEATGIGRDTLTKAYKFARQYTEGQVQSILKGKFVLSWFELAQSLSVAP